METTKGNTRKTLSKLKTKSQVLYKLVGAIPSGCGFWYFPSTNKETSPFNINVYFKLATKT